MLIRIRSTGQTMYESEFRANNPNTSFPSQITASILNEFGADPVLNGAQATGGTVYQYSQRDGVEQVDGKWYTKYILGPVFTDGETTAAEQEAAYKAHKDAEQAANVRNSRTEKPKDSDWTQIADSTADKAAWATYRQALRDITTASGFPWTMTWPESP